MATARPVTLSAVTPLRWLILGQFVNRAASGVRFLLVFYLVAERDWSPAAAGAAATAFALGALASQPVAGWCADHYGRRAVLVGTMAGASVALLALGLARAGWLVGVVAFVAGALNEGYRPALQAMVADLAMPDERVRAFGWVYWANNAGFTLAMAAGGLLAGVDWLLVFALDAAGCAAFALLAWRRLPETRPVVADEVAREPGGFATALRDPLLLSLCGLQLAFAFMVMQSAATLPLSMEADGLGPAAYGIVMAFAGLVVVALQPSAASALEHRPRGLVLAGGLLLVGAGFAATTAATGVAGFAATVGIWAVGEIAVACVAGAMVADLAPVALRGRYMGVFSTVSPLAAVLAPVVGTALFELAGEAVLWSACGIVGVAAAVAAVGLSPALAARTRPA